MQPGLTEINRGQRSKNGKNKQIHSTLKESLGLPGEQIMRLTVEQRLVLALVDLEKLEYAQAASVTGLSIWKIRHHPGDAWQSLILSSNLA
jgi:hypothetical protein